MGRSKLLEKQEREEEKLEMNEAECCWLMNLQGLIIVFFRRYFLPHIILFIRRIVHSLENQRIIPPCLIQNKYICVELLSILLSLQPVTR